MAITQIIFLSITIIVFINTSVANDKILTRKKRYLVFPEGSSLSIAICMTAQMGITPGEIFTEGINWGISYELPNDTKTFKEFLDKPKEVVQRRHRRDLYYKIENIIKSMGYNGRNCVLRALCEASRYLKPKGESQSLVDEVLRIVFRYPKKYSARKEEERHYQYYRASQKGIESNREECFKMFPGCPFSLIDLALGYYSAFGYYAVALNSTMLIDKQFKLFFMFFIFHGSWWYAVSNEKNTSLTRTKRTLIWEKGNSRLQIITGFGVPVDLSLETVIIGAIIKGNYVLPSNVSDLKPFGNVYYQKRKKRALSRWDVYELLAQLWQQRGFGGKSCILRAICELSHRPVDKNYGLFDELVHAIFTPSSTKETIRQHSDNEYFAAQNFGRKSGDSCKAEFSDCESNLVDLFTM